MHQQRQILVICNEDNSVKIEVPSLSSCVTQGDTLEEALANVREAIDLYIELLIEDGEPLTIPQKTLWMLCTEEIKKLCEAPCKFCHFFICNKNRGFILSVRA